MHALMTNDIFLLVGDLVCRLVARCATNGGDLDEARTPFTGFVQLPWWDVAATPEGADPKDFADTLRALCEESAGYLGAAVPHGPGLAGLFTLDFFGTVVGMFEQNNVGVRVPSPLHAFVIDCLGAAGGGEEAREKQDFIMGNLQTLAGVVAFGEENECYEGDEGDEGEEGCGSDCDSHDGHVHHEHGDAGDQGAAVGEEEVEVELAAEVAEPATLLETIRAALVPDDLGVAEETVAGDEDDGDDEGEAKARAEQVERMFVPLDGVGLFTWICLANHSCEPNAEVRYVGGGEVTAEMVALRDIPSGEEIVHSYIDRDLPRDYRQQSLKDYGFACDCPRCERERPVWHLAAPVPAALLSELQRTAPELAYDKTGTDTIDGKVVL